MTLYSQSWELRTAFQSTVDRFMSPQTIISGIVFGNESSICLKTAISIRYLMSSGGLYRVLITMSKLSRVFEQATQHSGNTMSSCLETRVLFTAIRKPS